MKYWTRSDVKTYFWEVAFRSRILYLWALELWIFAYSKLHLIDTKSDLNPLSSWTFQSQFAVEPYGRVLKFRFWSEPSSKTQVFIPDQWSCNFYTKVDDHVGFSCDRLFFKLKASEMAQNLKRKKMNSKY